MTGDTWRIYKLWFWAATVYNAAWGTLVGLKPSLLLDWMGMTSTQQATAGPLPGILASCIGMFVGVYALGYACVAWDPVRFWPFALLGLVGKVLGPAGWVLHHWLGHLAWPSLWVNVFNDLIWWPAFVGLLLAVRREHGWVIHAGPASSSGSSRRVGPSEGAVCRRWASAGLTGSN